MKQSLKMNENQNERKSACYDGENNWLPKQFKLNLIKNRKFKQNCQLFFKFFFYEIQI